VNVFNEERETNSELTLLSEVSVLSKKHHNSPEQKAIMAHRDTETAEEYAYKQKPAPGHREQSKHKKV